MTTATEPLLGVWIISGLSIVDGEEDGILVILPNDRAVQFPTAVAHPRANPTMRLWYSRLDETTIRFSYKPGGSGWLRFVERTPQGWNLIGDDHTGRSVFPCRAVPASELPEWYPEMLRRSIEKMTEVEAQENDLSGLDSDRSPGDK